MPLTQLSAVTGRKIKPRYVSAINTMTPYLYSKYSAKAARDYENKMLALREKELRQQQKSLKQGQAFAQKALEEEKEQARKSGYLELANLGLTAGMGAAREGWFGEGKGREIEQMQSMTYPNTTLAEAQPGFGMGKGLSDWGRWGESFAKLGPWTSGLLGYGASRFVGKDARPLERAAIGAGIGAGITALTGGSTYDIAASGILGGIGGLF